MAALYHTDVIRVRLRPFGEILLSHLPLLPELAEFRSENK